MVAGDLGRLNRVPLISLGAMLVGVTDATSMRIIEKAVALLGCCRFGEFVQNALVTVGRSR